MAATTALFSLNEETKDPGRELSESESDKGESVVDNENVSQSQRTIQQRQRGQRTQRHQRATNLRRSIHMNNQAA